MRVRVLGSLAGQVATLSAYVEHSCKVSYTFVYSCPFRIGPRDLARGLERCGQNSASNLVEPVVFKTRDFKCWEIFSSQLEDRSACNESLTCWEYLHLHWHFDLLVWGKKCWSVECSRWVCRSGTVVIMSPQFKKKVLGWSFCVDLADFLHVPVGSSQTHVRYINCWPHCCPDNVCVGIKNYVPADLKHFLNNI